MAVPQDLAIQNGSSADTTAKAPAPDALVEALYRPMRTAQVVDRIEQELCAAGEAFFQIAGLGHEAAAALNLFLKQEDWLHPHYRDKALMIARGVEPKAWFDSVLTNADSYSQGRQMCCFMANRQLNLPSTVIPVGNNALQAVGIAMQVKDDPANPIVICGLGDGTTQQGEVMEAMAEAARSNLPVLFWIEDNGVAISTDTTGQTFYNFPGASGKPFWGLDIHRFDGRDVLSELDRIGTLVDEVRESRGPRIGVMRVDRLCSHSNADDQRIYRTAEMITELDEKSNAVVNLRKSLINAGVDAAKLDRVDQAVEAECREAVEASRRVGDPEPCATASRPLAPEIQPGADEYLGDTTSGDEAITMIDAMRRVLRSKLGEDDRVTLLGQDIEDPKGDVFGVTKGLSTDYPGRVVNAPLTESTIIGTSIGRALAGGRPIGFIQFADFLPTGIGQLMNELGSMYWRTNGQFECPVILMITCGAYRPGLGPFHSQTLESTLAHIPGVDVMIPSSASDAAAMLNAAFKSNRPTVFLYPKVCLNDRAPWKVTSPDIEKHLTPVGTARTLHEGNDLTIVSWASTVTIGMGVAEMLATKDVGVDLIDLRCINPWDKAAIVASVKKTGKLLVVHEDNLTAGFGAEVVAGVVEALGQGVVAKRVTRADTWVPCNYTNQLEVLPSYRKTLTVACDMLGLDIGWPATVVAGDDDDSVQVVEAQGSSPADQEVMVSVWNVKVGDEVTTGQIIADMEADKATFEFGSPCDGVVAEILIEPDEKVPVGTPVIKIKTATNDGEAKVVKRQTREDMGHPVISKRDASPSSMASTSSAQQVRVYLSPIHIAEGKDRLTNEVLEQRFPEYSAEDIVQRTGIESRPILSRKQTALSIGVEAAKAALAAEGLTLDDLTGIVCHTTTPPLNTPSMACMILRELDPEAKHELMVYDVNAACSGWLYALDTAYHSILSQPHKAVLVVTTEALSRVVDPKDFGTAILFGDAATATIMRGCTQAKPMLNNGGSAMVLKRPVLSGKADKGDILTVAFQGQGHIHMDGKSVYTEAVRAMTKMVKQAFDESGIPLEQVDWLVPHQANRRIFESVQKRLKVPGDKVIDLIAEHGNTSSSSIPLSIAKSADKFKQGDTIGLCAFGGGFTFGAAVMEVE
ncbi:MAG: beta-ketoacyl-ACP synthase 3 [Phycisphaeraceae bacterium]|nr:beta-ketoacyl-ACP synthase 3 [Phycisphaeraceae bacterium]